jgi:hypothetical protein
LTNPTQAPGVSSVRIYVAQAPRAGLLLNTQTLTTTQFDDAAPVTLEASQWLNGNAAAKVVDLAYAFYVRSHRASVTPNRPPAHIPLSPQSARAVLSSANLPTNVVAPTQPLTAGVRVHDVAGAWSDETLPVTVSVNSTLVNGCCDALGRLVDARTAAFDATGDAFGYSLLLASAALQLNTYTFSGAGESLPEATTLRAALIASHTPLVGLTHPLLDTYALLNFVSDPRIVGAGASVATSMLTAAVQSTVAVIGDVVARGASVGDGYGDMTMNELFSLITQQTGVVNAKESVADASLSPTATSVVRGGLAAYSAWFDALFAVGEAASGCPVFFGADLLPFTRSLLSTSERSRTGNGIARAVAFRYLPHLNEAFVAIIDGVEMHAANGTYAHSVAFVPYANTPLNGR